MHALAMKSDLDIDVQELFKTEKNPEIYIKSSWESVTATPNQFK